VPPDLVDQRLKLGGHVVELCEILKECIFGSDGFAHAIGADRPLVDAARNPIIVRAGFSEVFFDKGEGLVAQVEAGMDAEAVQPSPSPGESKRTADAVHALGRDRQSPHRTSKHLAINGETRWKHRLPGSKRSSWMELRSASGRPTGRLL
jgi:hypothetical protein